MPAPEPDPTEARFLADLASAGLSLPPAELAGVLETARYLARSAALVADYLAKAADEPL